MITEAKMTFTVIFNNKLYSSSISIEPSKHNLLDGRMTERYEYNVQQYLAFENEANVNNIFFNNNGPIIRSILIDLCDVPNKTIENIKNQIVEAIMKDCLSNNSTQLSLPGIK